jgi:hypothetical protein
MEHTNSTKIYAKWTTKMQRNISILYFISFGSMDHILKKDDNNTHLTIGQSPNKL